MSNKELICASPDARYYQFNFRLLLGLFFGFSVFNAILDIILFWEFSREMLISILAFTVVFAVFYLPGAIYYAVRLSSLVKRCDGYIYSEAEISEYSPDGLWNRASLSAIIEDENSKPTKVATASIYTLRGSYLRLDTWYKKRAKVAYDKENDRLIICKLI